jgi:3-hydroxyisobutyrate dehydrogenase-like beta-hydroxyacid dehydrogenase
MAVTVGIVGLGLLGHAVASRLRAAGQRLVGFDVVPERCDAFAKLGGEVLGSGSDVAKTADAVCTLLPSLAAVENVILRDILGAARPGTTVVQMSTISPALTEKLAREVSARGIEFLDCPISGTAATGSSSSGASAPCSSAGSRS